MALVWEIVLIIVFVPIAALLVLVGLVRWGRVFPSFGRWLNPRLRRVRLGRLIVDDEMKVEDASR